MEITLSECLIKGSYRPLNLRLVCFRFQGQGKVFLSALRLSRVSYPSSIAARSGFGTMTISEAAVPSQPHCTSLVQTQVNPLNRELNPICCLLALLGANHFLHVSRIKVKSLTPRLLMSYTGWNRRNVPDFGRVFLMLKYTDITQNTYIQS